jgi:hypothetical protein
MVDRPEERSEEELLAFVRRTERERLNALYAQQIQDLNARIQELAHQADMSELVAGALTYTESRGERRFRYRYLVAVHVHSRRGDFRLPPESRAAWESVALAAEACNLTAQAMGGWVDENPRVPDIEVIRRGAIPVFVYTGGPEGITF